MPTYYQLHRDECLRKVKEYYKAHREKKILDYRRYYQTHREECLRKQKIRDARKVKKPKEQPLKEKSYKDYLKEIKYKPVRLSNSDRQKILSWKPREGIYTQKEYKYEPLCQKE